MIKHIERLLFLLLPALAFTACTEDEGTTPGNDGGPNLTIYEQTTTLPNDADVDGTYRVATNNKTEQVYYLAEPAASASSDDAYAQKVVSQGTAVTLGTDTVSGGKVADVVVKDMPGEYTVSFVAVNGNTRTLKQVSFTGLIWNDIASGTYQLSRYHANWNAPATNPATLQQLSTDPTQYRIKNAFGNGHHLRFVSTGTTDSDEDGAYTYVTVADQSLPYEYGSYGTIYIRDVATWQNDASYSTDPSYGCKLYDSHDAVFVINFHVSAGRLTGATYSYFIAD